MPQWRLLSCRAISAINQSTLNLSSQQDSSKFLKISIFFCCQLKIAWLLTDFAEQVFVRHEAILFWRRYAIAPLCLINDWRKILQLLSPRPRESFSFSASTKRCCLTTAWWSRFFTSHGWIILWFSNTQLVVIQRLQLNFGKFTKICINRFGLITAVWKKGFLRAIARYLLWRIQTKFINTKLPSLPSMDKQI